jgi:predicted MFS family arabinose efflux permease
LVGTAVGSLLTGLAAGVALLCLGRIVDGASGASVSVAQASVADIADPGERARLYGLLGAAFGLGFVLGPALGGIFSLINARVPFFVAAALAGVNALVAVRRLPETHPGHEQAEIGGDSRARRLAVLRQPEVVKLIVVAFLSLVSFSAFEASFALFGQRRLGLTESSTYAVFVLIGVLIAVDQAAFVHPAVARFGERGALRAGLILNAAGLGLLGGVHSALALAPCLVLLTLGQGLITPTLSSAVAGAAQPAQRGRLLGVQQSAGGLARVVGPAVGDLAFGRLGVWVPYVGGAGLLVLALGLLLAVPLHADGAIRV